MSRNTDSPARPLPRLAAGHALARLADAASDLAGLSRDEWVESRLRAAILAELGASNAEFLEPHALPLLRWIAGNLALDVEALPDAAEMADAFGLEELPKPRRRPRSARAEPALHQLYDRCALQAAMERVRDDEQRHHFRALLRSPHQRTLVPVTAAQQRAVLSLLGQAPHLREATESVVGALAIARRSRAPLRQPPLLLWGPPATGKTWWAGRIAEALGVPCARIVMPKVTASFALSGSTSAWSNSRPGRIVQEFMGMEGATPVLILDEVDKISAGNYDPAPVLLDLLEPESARHWRDEFFDMEFDVSRAIIIATANRPQDMDPALRSRFREVEVGRPAKCDLPAVIHSAWARHRRQHPGLRLPRELPDEAVACLVQGFTSIRELQRSFEDAVARAARRPGRLRLLASDLAGANPLRLVRGTRG